MSDIMDISGSTILIVDDSPVSSMVVSLMLKKKQRLLYCQGVEWSGMYKKNKRGKT